MRHVTDVYLRDTTNKIFFPVLHFECELSEGLFFLLHIKSYWIFMSAAQDHFSWNR